MVTYARYAILILFAIALGLFVSTEFVAWQLAFHKALGAPIWQDEFVKIYNPLLIVQWIYWGWWLQIPQVINRGLMLGTITFVAVVGYFCFEEWRRVSCATKSGFGNK